MLICSADQYVVLKEHLDVSIGCYNFLVGSFESKLANNNIGGHQIILAYFLVMIIILGDLEAIRLCLFMLFKRLVKVDIDPRSSGYACLCPGEGDNV